MVTPSPLTYDCSSRWWWWVKNKFLYSVVLKESTLKNCKLLLAWGVTRFVVLKSFGFLGFVKNKLIIIIISQTVVQTHHATTWRASLSQPSEQNKWSPAGLSPCGWVASGSCWATEWLPLPHSACRCSGGSARVSGSVLAASPSSLDLKHY